MATRQSILSLHAAGQPIRAIAASEGVSIRRVYQVLRPSGRDKPRVAVREAEVRRLRMRGLSDRAIAARLHISRTSLAKLPAPPDLEPEVSRLRLSGYPDREICRRLGISRRWIALIPRLDGQHPTEANPLSDQEIAHIITAAAAGHDAGTIRRTLGRSHAVVAKVIERFNPKESP